MTLRMTDRVMQSQQILRGAVPFAQNATTTCSARHVRPAA